MTATWKSWPARLLAVLLSAMGGLAWWLHARAWDLGGHTPLLNGDAAQVAIAARELALHGRLATLFALPIELASHPAPPWPLAIVQPGLVLVEALLFTVARMFGAGTSPESLAPLTLASPVACFILLGLVVFIGTLRISDSPGEPYREPGSNAVARGASGAVSTSRVPRLLLASVAALLVWLDPEAQHLAVNGLPELPFTLGWTALLFAIALGHAARWPLAFGVVLGVTGLFRPGIAWLGPLAILAAAWSAAPGTRRRVLALAVLGGVIPLAPWWTYKWRAFGSPAWDSNRGADAIPLLAAKLSRQLPELLLLSLTGLRGLWFGSLVLWLVIARPARALVAAVLAALGAATLGVVAAAVTLPWPREMFPSRLPLEAAGWLSLVGLLSRAPDAMLGARARNLLIASVAVLALGWGVRQSSEGNRAAQRALDARVVPSTESLRSIADLLVQRAPAGATVMSNLGPLLAWPLERPVLQLALTPDEVSPLRRLHEFRFVLLALRDSDRAWPAWVEIAERPGAARTHATLGAIQERRFRTADGFTVIWLELGPLAPALAARELRSHAARSLRRVGHHLDPDARHALSQEAEFAGRAPRHVDHASAAKRSAIVDAQEHARAIRKVRDLDAGAERQRAMRRGQLGLIEALPVRGAATLEVSRVVRSLADLGSTRQRLDRRTRTGAAVKDEGQGNDRAES